MLTVMMHSMVVSELIDTTILFITAEAMVVGVVLTTWCSPRLPQFAAGRVGGVLRAAVFILVSSLTAIVGFLVAFCVLAWTWLMVLDTFPLANLAVLDVLQG